VLCPNYIFFVLDFQQFVGVVTGTGISSVKPWFRNSQKFYFGDQSNLE